MPVEECRACGEKLVCPDNAAGSGATSHVCSKVCIVCKHPACPFCGNWCDTLIDTDEEDGAMCCEGECTYAAEEPKSA
jgi:hypothetical protein